MIQVLTIAFTACRLLAADGSALCQDVELRGYGTVQSCILGAQPTVAAWLQEHKPGWVVDGPIRCQTGEGA